MARPPIWTPDQLEAFGEVDIATPAPAEYDRLKLPRVVEAHERDRETRRRLGLRDQPPPPPPPPPPAEHRHKRPRRRRR